jgi:antitoxin component YwqK of YwqJK toxin-antitoxin module
MIISKKAWLLICIFPLISILPYGCAKKDREEVISTYPSGEKQETSIFQGEKPNRRKLISYEYYRTGEKKRAYHYKDNHYFGPWTYWYRNGGIMAEGTFFAKTLVAHEGKGKGIYYWPDGGKMMNIESKIKDDGKSNVIYYDKNGSAYSNEDLPQELKEKIRSVIDRWEKGEI